MYIATAKILLDLLLPASGVAAFVNTVGSPFDDFLITRYTSSAYKTKNFFLINILIYIDSLTNIICVVKLRTCMCMYVSTPMACFV